MEKGKKKSVVGFPKEEFPKLPKTKRKILKRGHTFKLNQIEKT